MLIVYGVPKGLRSVMPIQDEGYSTIRIILNLGLKNDSLLSLGSEDSATALDALATYMLSGLFTIGSMSISITKDAQAMGW